MSEFDATIPIYLQIMTSIKHAIVTGTLHPGDRLPSVREQAESFSVNPNTVQRAYQELEREAISETRRGMGTYIVENKELISNLRTEMAQKVIQKYLEGMRSLGFSNDEILKSLTVNLKGGNL